MARADAIELTALEHIHELMRRMLWSVIFLVCGGALAYVFRLEIIEFLQRPLHQQLYYTSPMGSFQFVMQICLLCGVLCSLPVLLYHLLRFIEPAFTKEFLQAYGANVAYDVVSADNCRSCFCILRHPSARVEIF